MEHHQREVGEHRGDHSEREEQKPVVIQEVVEVEVEVGVEVPKTVEVTLPPANTYRWSP